MLPKGYPHYKMITSQNVSSEAVFVFFVREIWRTGVKLHVLYNLATCSNYSIINYVKILFNFFEKVDK